MLSLIFIYGLLAYFCVNAVVRPHVGIIGYYCFFLLQPEWNWRWVFSPDQGFQKYIAIATLVGLCIQKRAEMVTPGKVRWACGLLAVFICLAWISYNQSIAPGPTYIYIDALWKIVLMALIGIYVIDTPEKLHALMWTLVLSQGFNAYRINESYFQNGVCFFRTDGYGFNGDNNLYSILTVPIMAMSASLALYSRPLWQKGLAAVILVLQMHQIMLMESRGTMLGAVFMIPLLVWYMPKNLTNLWAVACCTLLGIALAGPPVIKEFMSSFESVENRDSSAESRFKVWRAGFDIALDNPILGVGPWAGQFLVPEYGGFGGDRKGLHNLFFEILTGCGFPASACYFAFFAIATWGTFKMCRQGKNLEPEDWIGCSALAVFPGIIGYMISSMFSSGALLESSYALAVLGLASIRIAANSPNDDVERTEEQVNVGIDLDQKEQQFKMESRFEEQAEQHIN